MARVPSCIQETLSHALSNCLFQVAYLHQMTKSLIVAPDGNLQFPEGGDGDRRPEWLVLIAQVFTAQGRFSQRAVVVVDDGRSSMAVASCETASR